MERFLGSADPAIRRLAGDQRADVMQSPKVKILINFPAVHPYKKWWGTHWRLVSLADLEVNQARAVIEPGIEQELKWLASPRRRIKIIDGLVRHCASQEGNAVYACSRLGFASDPRVTKLVNWLIDWQWPDGGWNCDQKASGRRSSFHETVTPALGLVEYYRATGERKALTAAQEAAGLLLEHNLFRSLKTGEVIDPAWLKPHYPPYWHYDLLQGLRLIDAVGFLPDPRADEALEILEKNRRKDGRFAGPKWYSKKQPDAVDWGSGAENEMLNLLIEKALLAGRKNEKS